MSPAVPKTSEALITRAARRIVEQEGAEALSMQSVAERVGVRAPSLYKRFAHREAILEAVTEEVFEELRSMIVAAADGHAPGGDLLKMARAYRAFAKRSPHLYALMFVNRTDSARAAALRAAAAEPVL